MKKLVLPFLFIGSIMFFSSCETTDPVDEINLQDEVSKQGNDKVVRKKPGRTTYSKNIEDGIIDRR